MRIFGQSTSPYALVAPFSPATLAPWLTMSSVAANDAPASLLACQVLYPSEDESDGAYYDAKRCDYTHFKDSFPE